MKPKRERHSSLGLVRVSDKDFIYLKLKEKRCSKSYKSISLVRFLYIKGTGYLLFSIEPFTFIHLLSIYLGFIYMRPFYFYPRIKIYLLLVQRVAN